MAVVRRAYPGTTTRRREEVDSARLREHSRLMDANLRHVCRVERYGRSMSGDRALRYGQGAQTCTRRAGGSPAGGSLARSLVGPAGRELSFTARIRRERGLRDAGQAWRGGLFVASRARREPAPRDRWRARPRAAISRLRASGANRHPTADTRDALQPSVRPITPDLAQWAVALPRLRSWTQEPRPRGLCGGAPGILRSRPPLSADSGRPADLRCR